MKYSVSSSVENHTERKIKTLQSDYGGEFTSEEFKELCRESGIKRELSTPYNPQQNGVMERKNQTIMGVAKPGSSYAPLGRGNKNNYVCT